MLDRQQRESGRTLPIRSSTSITAAFLIKLAKHLALLGCLMIVGAASGRFAPSEVAILLTIVAAAFLHSAGRALELRLPAAERWPRSES